MDVGTPETGSLSRKGVGVCLVVYLLVAVGWGVFVFSKPHPWL